MSTMNIGKQSLMHFCDNMDDDDGLPSLRDECAHLCFTSPPYWNYVDYAGGVGVGKENTYQAYLISIATVMVALHYKLVPGGKLVINVSNMASRKDVDGDESFIHPIAFDINTVACKAGFIFKDEIIWHKAGGNSGSLKGKMLFGSYPYPPTPRFLSSMFEYIFVFQKPGKRQPIAKAFKEQAAFTKEEWLEYTKGIWQIQSDRNEDHPATFPLELAERVVRLFTFPGDVVLDPFAGSGTTLVAAEKHDRLGFGWEIAKEYREAVDGNVKKHLDQLTIEGIG